jgi:hypothetical protein
MRPATLALALVVIAGCGNDHGVPPTITERDPEARALYPDLAHLYEGDQGIYRGCGPNGGVCHNGNEFPNLDSIGSIVDNIGRDCNQKRDNATSVHDMCERKGDLVELPTLPATKQIEIGWVGAVDNSGDPPRIWKLTLRDSASSVVGSLGRMPLTRDGAFVLYLRDYLQSAVLDPTDPTGRTIILTLTPPPGSGYDFGSEVAKHFAKIGIPGTSDAFYVGDPNRDGIFGADLGAKFIKPGDPQRSYLLRRLTDPSAGPLMPRANCCFWSKPALRALWCWVAGLDATGSNALAPIDYDRCPISPGVLLSYPDPGPECEAQGLCPVVATGGTNEPTFPSIYTEILVPKCGGEGCHDREPLSGGLDMRAEDTAFTTIRNKVVVGDPAASTLIQRLDPALCQAPCKTMPLDRATLPPEDLARIETWIRNGATPE